MFWSAALQAIHFHVMETPKSRVMIHKLIIRRKHHTGLMDSLPRSLVVSAAQMAGYLRSWLSGLWRHFVKTRSRASESQHCQANIASRDVG